MYCLQCLLDARLRHRLGRWMVFAVVHPDQPACAQSLMGFPHESRIGKQMASLWRLSKVQPHDSGAIVLASVNSSSKQKNKTSKSKSYNATTGAANVDSNSY